MRASSIPSILWSFVFAVLVCATAQAVEVPPLKGRVNDRADILSPATEQHLETILRELERTDSTQIVVLTIPSLQGESLEAFSIQVAEAWKIGQKGLDNGAILLIAPSERKLRIEVGYGLEGRLTDLVAGRIIRNVIVPRFKTGDFDQGVMDGVAAMIGVVRGEYTPPERVRRAPGGGGKHQGIFAFFAFFFLVGMLARLRRWLGVVAGGIAAPIIGGAFFHLGWIWLLLLIPVGAVASLGFRQTGGPLVFGHGGGRTGYRGGGGFSSGGGFGGFSGGGGGFGGGGASGGW